MRSPGAITEGATSCFNEAAGADPADANAKLRTVVRELELQ